MLDGIFHKRLQQHAGYHHIEGCGIEFLDHLQLVPAEANYFDVKVVIDEFKFFSQRDKRITAMQQTAKDVRQLNN